MAAFGLALLAFVGVALIVTGLPAFLVLIFAAILGAGAAVVSGTVPPALLGTLSSRLVNLFESDLLQALPLYVLMGALLNRLTVAPAVFRTLLRLLPPRPGTAVVSGLGLGALLAPMSGSVGASVLALARTVEPRLPLRHATIAVASTLGVVVPPSLVLILLGDAMLSAHTFAINATGRSDRVINTQDVLRAAIIPAALFLVLSLLVGWYSAPRGNAVEPEKMPTACAKASDIVLTLATVAFLVFLLGGVAAGYIFAVEGAATGAFLLMLAGVLTGQVNGKSLGPMLRESMATTGTLFAPLLAATTFTLVLRLLGTDKLIERWVTALPGGDIGATAAILGAIFVAAFVLDAFEIIFVAVPILIPALLIRVPDAVWISTLVLLTLQTSFLLPPVGYALMMTRGVLGSAVPPATFARALLPYLAAQILVLLLALGYPRLVHLLEPPNAQSRGQLTPLTTEDVEDRLRQMLPAPNPPGLPPMDIPAFAPPPSAK
jgi:TRAP-type mannitol/chloroaromatic compound transport system permease large subunit